MALREIFYLLKPAIPRAMQIFLRRKLIARRRASAESLWPIDRNSRSQPKGWEGWPLDNRFALVLTHDVDSAKGQDRCGGLMKMERSLEFKSSFNFVPERYQLDSHLRKYLTKEGFEVGVHGLNHDGKLYNSRKIFQERAIKINTHLEKWNAVGFRSPAMHHNLEWIHDLNIDYDASTFDTDPFEPQPDGVGTIFPFWVAGNSTRKGYVELPYTLPQDFTIFVLMRENNIEIWKKKLDWIAEHGGMALLNTHPDYMYFGDGKPGVEEYPAWYYGEFLQYIKDKYEGLYWHVLPRDMARYWSKHYSHNVF